MVAYFFSILMTLFFGMNDTFTYASTPESYPPAPYYYILDEPKILNPRALASFQTLLIEHERLAGEQFMIGIFDSKKSDMPENWSHQLFEAWKVGQRNHAEGALLVIYWKSKEVELITGDGLEDSLPLDKRNKIISKFVEPKVKQGRIQAALTSGIYQLLENQNSPLVISGKALQILENLPVVQEGNKNSNEWIILFFFGIFMFLVIIHELLSREALFSQNGWVRTRPFRWLKFLTRKFSQQTFPQHLPGGGTHGSW